MKQSARRLERPPAVGRYFHPSPLFPLYQRGRRYFHPSSPPSLPKGEEVFPPLLSSLSTKGGGSISTPPLLPPTKGGGCISTPPSNQKGRRYFHPLSLLCIPLTVVIQDVRFSFKYFYCSLSQTPPSPLYPPILTTIFHESSPTLCE